MSSNRKINSGKIPSKQLKSEIIGIFIILIGFIILAATPTPNLD